jgi:hypothetical protein
LQAGGPHIGWASAAVPALGITLDSDARLD